MARHDGGEGMLQEIVSVIDKLGAPEATDALRRGLPASWIEEALRVKGKASVRRRRLPAEQVVWLVLGMALFKTARSPTW